MKKDDLKNKDSIDRLMMEKMRRRNFIAFGTFFLFGGAGYWAWRKLYIASKELSGITAGTRVPLRKVVNLNESIFRKFFSSNHLVKTYPKEMAAKNVRQNSNIGVDDEDFDPLLWKLNIMQGSTSILQIGIDEIKALPKTEIVFDFKCVEGWDQIQYWGGLRFIDFIKHFKLENLTKKSFVGMETPNKEYYVGLDMESALHPQTILAYEMNGKPLPLNHGAPLRLIVPVKYGIKNIKRIGTISFNDHRPRDYWAEQGYDYYSGL